MSLEDNLEELIFLQSTPFDQGVAPTIEGTVKKIGKVKQQNKMSLHNIFSTNNVNLLYMYWCDNLPEERQSGPCLPFTLEDRF